MAEPGGMKNGSASVPNTVTWVTDANQRRYKITFVNNDAALSIWLFKGGGATANKGLLIRPYGTYEDTMDSRGNIYKGVYTAIASAAGPAILSYTEESN